MNNDIEKFVNHIDELTEKILKYESPPKETGGCIHSWYDVHPNFGDPSNPCGRRCLKCNKQERY